MWVDYEKERINISIFWEIKEMSSGKRGHIQKVRDGDDNGIGLK